ncbi:unnamed protein product [Schistocephalus solidus]|uniref:C2H2-type domain-containing protein n=1 Tax=Schistocephalus solidus TaxID=70667 RepID=A0A183TMY7_SCHSO|nr:unnamed protein product [Schistocephalus solidus]
MPTCSRCQPTFHARINFIGHLLTQCNKNPTTSTSATHATDPTTKTTPANDNNFFDVSPHTTFNTILNATIHAPIMATNTTCPTPTTSVATSEYLPPVTSNTTNAPSTSDGDSVLTCPHCDRTFTSHIGLVSHLRIHITKSSELVPRALPQPKLPPSMTSLPTRIHSSHVPDRSHAHPRKWTPPRCEHI